MKKLNKKNVLIITGAAIPLAVAALVFPRLLRRRRAKRYAVR